mgnify:CR=1 FL=1
MCKQAAGPLVCNDLDASNTSRIRHCSGASGGGDWPNLPLVMSVSFICPIIAPATEVCINPASSGFRIATAPTSECTKPSR